MLLLYDKSIQVNLTPAQARMLRQVVREELE